MTDSPPALELRGLEKHYNQSTKIVNKLLGREEEPVQAVDGVSMTVQENDSKAVIGESGCGKTTLLMTLMGLTEHTGGEILYKGDRISEFDKKDWKEFRRNVQIIFQDPFNSLDPKLSVKETLMEPLHIHDMDDKEQRVRDVLEQVELSPPEKFIDQLPSQLSGGEKQRVSIARALVLEPDIILADEPVSMLDVSTQASILRSLKNLIDELNVAMLYISHDISTVSYVANEINVMYLGRVVEQAPTEKLLEDPKHPYSEALISAIPVPDPHYDRERTELEGSPRDPIGIGEGCRFRDRCPEAMEICEKTPATVEVENNHSVACHLYYEHDQQLDEETFERLDGEAKTAESTTVVDHGGGN